MKRITIFGLDTLCQRRDLCNIGEGALRKIQDAVSSHFQQARTTWLLSIRYDSPFYWQFLLKCTFFFAILVHLLNALRDFPAIAPLVYQYHEFALHVKWAFDSSDSENSIYYIELGSVLLHHVKWTVNNDFWWSFMQWKKKIICVFDAICVVDIFCFAWRRIFRGKSSSTDSKKMDFLVQQQQ